MTDVDRLLSGLSDVARRDSAPPVDLRARVMQTLTRHPQVVPREGPLFAFAGVAVAAAAAMAIALLPAWLAALDPWTYFLVH